MDWTAFDFHQIDAVTGKRFQRCEERAGFVRKAERDGHFQRRARFTLLHPPYMKFGHQVCLGGGTCASGARWFAGAFSHHRDEKDKPGKVFGVVLDILGKNHATIMFGSAASSNRRTGFIAASESFPDTSGGVFCGHALQIRMRGEKTLALREGHRMRGHGAESLQGGTRATDEMVFDGENGFRDDAEIAFEQEIVNAHDRAGERIFHGNQKSVGGAFGDSAEGGIERCTWNSGDAFAQKLDGGGLAEGAEFALECHANRLSIEYGHSTRYLAIGAAKHEAKNLLEEQ